MLQNHNAAFVRISVFGGFEVRVGHHKISRPCDRAMARWAHRCMLAGSRAAFCLLQFMFSDTDARAQSLEPRAYSNSPVGLNFLIAGYAYSYGKIPFDPVLPIADAKYDQNTGLLAYARAFDVWGDSAKIDVVVPYAAFSAQTTAGRRSIQREASGLLDPQLRFSINFYGAPALSAKEFNSYQQDLVIGASVLMTAPLGQYDDSKFLNLGSNRWSFKTELGISKAWGPWTLEAEPSVTFFTDNTDFNVGNTLSQAPLYAVQGHLIYSFSSGLWLGLDGTWFTGGHTNLNGVNNDNMQTNTRLGATLALPMDENNSVKFYTGAGVTSRTGAYFDAVGVAWQHRWGAGL